MEDAANMVIWKKNLHVIESQHLHSAALYACTPVICSNVHHLNLRRALNKEKEAQHVFVLQMRAASSVMITVLTEADCNLMLQVTDINLQKCLLNEDDFLK